MLKSIIFSILELRSTITLIDDAVFLRIITKVRRRYNIEVVETVTVYELKKVLKIFVT